MGKAIIFFKKSSNFFFKNRINYPSKFGTCVKNYFFTLLVVLQKSLLKLFFVN